MSGERETFTSRFGLLMTMIGVAVGLGNVWRFPYMVGKFGGASFVAIYILAVVLLGIPALMAEWALGRHTRLGPLGAFASAGLPLGRYVGWFFFFVVTVATGYYTNAIGWVLYHGIGEALSLVRITHDPAAILPPLEGLDSRSLALQLACTAFVLSSCAVVLVKGLRAGIERASKLIMPTLLGIVMLLVLRTLTLPGAWGGVRWYLLKIDFIQLDRNVVVAALGQAFFSLSLGGTFMVVYGSYLAREEELRRNASWTASGDLIAGLLAGLAIVPAVIALGMEPESGPGLIFSTLPKVFDQIPFGGFFGLLFFVGLFGAAYLSAVAALEVLVAGVVDNTSISRTAAVWLMTVIVFVLSVPPMINMRVFVPWDLTFGSGMQTLGALFAVIAVGWCIDRREALRQLQPEGLSRSTVWLYHWLRFVVPAAILLVAAWWLSSSVL
jgi:NSS family neurotransmitter:Na+ symporter